MIFIKTYIFINQGNLNAIEDDRWREELEISISTHILVTDNNDLSRLLRSKATIFPKEFPISFKILGLIYSIGRCGMEIQTDV